MAIFRYSMVENSYRILFIMHYVAGVIFERVFQLKRNVVDEADTPLNLKKGRPAWKTTWADTSKLFTT